MPLLIGVDTRPVLLPRLKSLKTRRLHQPLIGQLLSALNVGRLPHRCSRHFHIASACSG